MTHLVSHWPASLVVLVLCGLVMALHLTGLRRLRCTGGAADGSQGGANPAREAAAFYGGLLAAAIAVLPPVAYWSGSYLWVRALQDLLLAVVAPSLIVLGAPWLALAAGLTAAAHRRPGRASRRRPARLGAAWRLAWPVGATVVFNIVWLGWHLPVLYDAAVTSQAARYAEYATFLAAGIWFWLQLIGSRPSSPAAPPPRRLALLIGTAAADTVLGMVLVFGSALLYPAYAGPARGLSLVIADQQLAGAVLWMGILPSLIIAAVAILMTWLDNEERDDPSRDLERLTTPRPAGWPSSGGSGVAGWPSRTRYRPPAA
ncbi:MAG: cytochrome c oxidase assembly protein [Streptosporangiaceae bacterium]|jgi:cytochrome c oxidase assembly factor CtaG